jgi:hypothetical protein
MAAQSVAAAAQKMNADDLAEYVADLPPCRFCLLQIEGTWPIMYENICQPCIDLLYKNDEHGYKLRTDLPPTLRDAIKANLARLSESKTCRGSIDPLPYVKISRAHFRVWRKRTAGRELGAPLPPFPTKLPAPRERSRGTTLAPAAVQRWYESLQHNPNTACEHAGFCARCSRCHGCECMLCGDGTQLLTHRVCPRCAATVDVGLVRAQSESAAA